MTLKCGRNEFRSAVTAASTGHATQRQALDAALTDLFLPGLLRLVAAWARFDGQDCPAGCPAATYEDPALRATTFELVQEPQGTFGYRLALELTAAIDCKDTSRLAMADVELDPAAVAGLERSAPNPERAAEPAAPTPTSAAVVSLTPSSSALTPANRSSAKRYRGRSQPLTPGERGPAPP